MALATWRSTAAKQSSSSTRRTFRVQVPSKGFQGIHTGYKGISKENGIAGCLGICCWDSISVQELKMSKNLRV